MTARAALLPYDRPLTDDELRGFNTACACMITWGRQIAQHGVSLPPVEVRPAHLMAEKGKFLATTAEALAITIGQLPSLPRIAA